MLFYAWGIQRPLQNSDPFLELLAITMICTLTSHTYWPTNKAYRWTKKQVLPWTNECELAFKQTKALLAEDVLLSYPDHTQPFHVYTDASDYQLVAVTMQNEHPLAFYSCKLSPAQANFQKSETKIG